MMRNITETEQEILKGDYTRGMNGVAVVKNTFWQDFTIADAFGERAVLDTFKRAFESWREDISYITALSIALNHKIWQHYEAGNEKLARLYDKCWKDVERYVLDCENAGEENEKYKNYEKDEVRYYVSALD